MIHNNINNINNFKIIKMETTTIKMETTTIYELTYDNNDKQIIEELEAYVFINPLTGIKTWLVKDEGRSRSYYESEFEENNYFLTKELANEFILNEANKELEFIKICNEFIDNCEKYEESNPFIEIGQYHIRREIKEFVNGIEDQTFKYYANSRLYSSTYLSDICEAILPKTEQAFFAITPNTDI